MSDLLQDLRLALRQLVKNPAFTAVAVLTLALGIGANTAIFSAVNAVLMRPLPYPESERLVEVTSTNMGGVRFGVSFPDLQDLRGMSHDFTGVAAYATQRYNLSGAGDPREVQAAFVTADLFDVLRVLPAIGHPFAATQEREPVALISYGLWVTSFGRDPGILGRAISLDGKSYTVVGVMPAGFHFPDEAVQVWTPVGGILAEEPRALTFRGFHALNAVARLAPGISEDQVARDLDLLAKRIAAETGGDTASRTIVATGGGPGGPAAQPRSSGSPLDNSGFAAVSLRDSAIGDVRTPAARAAGGRRPGAADRLRQRRQPVAGPGRCATPGNGHPPRPRSQSRAAHPPTAHRERSAGARRRRARTRVLHMGPRRPAHALAQSASPRQ